ncbi:MAG TPA: hypothetical protein VE987_03325 [Polyangiaceae bacterium]|nr:hypothetical protein [Polyangiaceae bacterium]
MAIGQRPPSFPRVAASAVSFALLTGGCSVLFHADPSQCSTSNDCAVRGFTGYTCAQGTCIAPAEASPQCTTDRDCSSGFACSQGTCVPRMTMLDGGAEAEAGCTTNADCPAVAAQTVACDVDTHSCLQLTSQDCPAIIGDVSGSVAPPIFVGAFAVFPTQGGPLTHPSYLNYNLALSEFQKQTNGIPAGPGQGYRMPVAVACDVSADVNRAMTHLTADLHVPVVVAPLAAATLSSVFTNFAAADKSDVLLINPFSADSTLTALPTNGLMWHLLGQAADNAPAYAAFLPLVESYIRNHAPWNLGSTTPLKVATVTANATATNSLASAVQSVLTWNGGASTMTDTTNYLSVVINDSTLNGTSLSSIDVSAAVQQILTFQPHVIISFASEEFTRLVENVEIGWSGSKLPFYVIGPYNMGSTLLQGDVANLPFTNTRFAGIGVASAADMTELSQYESRFLGAYPTRADALDEENYYDAMYFAVYSLVAAGRIQATGSDLAAGMRRLISLTSMPYQIGPADMGNIYPIIGPTRGSIDFIGTLGPPNFDTATGSRIGAGDVYCLAHEADAGVPYQYVYDVLRLNNPDGGAPGDGGSAFQGTFPCYPGIQ